jgi:uncharacterized protein
MKRFSILVFLGLLVGCSAARVYQNSDSTNQLVEAASEGDLQEVRDQIRLHTDLEATDAQDGITPLIGAARNGRVEVVAALLKAGAKVDGADRINGAAALAWVAAGESEEVLGYKPSMEDRIRVMQMLLDAGAKVNATNHWGATALQWAADANALELVQILLKAGADVNAADQQGLTALMAASNHDAPESLQVVELLIQSKANVDLQNRNGETALMIAATSNFKTGNVSALLRAGAQVDERDQQGQTALMKACRSDRVDVASVLVKAGADVQAKNKSGQSVWDIAKQAGYQDVLQFLSEIDVNNSH